MKRRKRDGGREGKKEQEACVRGELERIQLSHEKVTQHPVRQVLS